MQLMQLYRFLFFIHGVYSSLSILAAASPFDECAAAIVAGHADSFKTLFSPELLTVYEPSIFGEESPTVRLVTLAHIAAMVKKPASKEIMEHMLKKGLDPNRVESIFVRAVRATPLSNGRTRIDGYNGYASTPLVLDLAVISGNVPVVTTLLENGADPHKTRLYLHMPWWKILAKEWFSEMIGETPYTLAISCLKKAYEGLAPGTVEEYQGIAQLLQNKYDVMTQQAMDDLHPIS